MTPLLLVALLSADFPEVYNSDPDAGDGPMPAAEAAASFTKTGGLKVSVWASEPDVQNPIDMAWDAKGRMWIAENYTYSDRSQKFDLSLRDRVIILDDTDGDHVADKRVVFTDDVQMLTSVEIGRGGVWLMCPPRLLFVPDNDRNDEPDGPPITVLDGFTVAEENYHNFANGLRWGPDGWLYGRCGGSCPGRIGAPGTPNKDRVAIEGGIWRFHPERKTFEVLCHGTTNPWGLDWNEWGEGFFINTVNGHFWHLIPGAHYKRPFTLDPNPHVYELIDQHADHYHFDTAGAWHEQRDGKANDFGGGHAHCGLMIYQGDDWPEQYRGKAFTWNFHGRRLNQETLERSGSGYVAKHAEDLLLSGDPFFRGMELSTGPDGAVYAIDWSDIGECHEHTGVHRTSGRVFRISSRHSPSGEHRQERAAFAEVNRADFDLLTLKQDRSVLDEFEYREGESENDLIDRLRSLAAKMPPHPLSSLLLDVNSWQRNVAARCLADQVNGVYQPAAWDGLEELTVYCRGSALENVLLDMFRTAKGDDDLATSRALRAMHMTWTATSTCMIQRENARKSTLAALRSQNESLRAAAVCLLTDHWPLDDIYGPTSFSRREQRQVRAEWAELKPTLLKVASEDESGLVRLNLASTIQRLPLEARAELAAALASRPEDADDHNLPLLVWYGLAPVAELDPVALANVALKAEWPTLRRLIARRLATLIDEQSLGVETVLAGLVDTSEATRRDIVVGLAQGLEGLSRVEKPDGWEGVATLGHDAETAAIIRELSLLFGDGRALEEVRALVSDDSADIGLRRTALESLVDAGGLSPEELQPICLPLLVDPRLNVPAARGLARCSDPKVADELVKRYRNFRAPTRPQVIEILVSRPAFAARLLDGIEKRQSKLSPEALTAYDVRQIRSLGDESLIARVSEIWGDVRDTPEKKREQIEALKAALSGPQASSLPPQEEAAGFAEAMSLPPDLPAGRALFAKSCAKCHMLFGSGEKIGPDLTGANRTNLDYLLENIIDPSAVVSKDYRMTVLLLADGRTLNGLVTSRNDNTLTLQTQNERVTIALEDIEVEQLTTQSPMPEGLLDTLTPEQIRDLFGYLRSPAQVPLP